MEKFMVEITKPESYINNTAEFDLEHTRFADLMHENILQLVNINQEMTKIWLIFTVKDRETMEQILQTIPICSSLERKISALR